ncbi:hypothetical protein COLO4_10728 [Corchorus olitorius]|uniref:Uncharacterized protein n=1 Tax=Corchorus olitorius TaxID=93759 RepID=A0A1R3K710_9ROSI|nr:hypothetical protein COLO4_10728 [Corchorus olitorius]
MKASNNIENRGDPSALIRSGPTQAPTVRALAVGSPLRRLFVRLLPYFPKTLRKD